MQKPDEWASDSDFTNNSESENNINGTNEDKPDNTEEQDPSRNEDKPDGTEQDLSEDDGSVLSDNEEDNYFIRLKEKKQFML